jgi:Fe-S-cluster containining protein
MERILKKHHLKHIPELKVGENLLRYRFSSGCSMSNCDGYCCKLGVFADVKERDKILAHVDLIHRYMEPHQEHDPAKWFDDHEFEDKDFLSGWTIGTVAKDYGCVFLNSAGRCTLQKACTEEGMPPYYLKPFYCVAFPIAIDGGVLIIDDVELENRPQCCLIDLNGTLNVFDVCLTELEYVLGREGVEELRVIFDSSKKL